MTRTHHDHEQRGHLIQVAATMHALAPQPPSVIEAQARLIAAATTLGAQASPDEIANEVRDQAAQLLPPDATVGAA